jgi:glutamine synthetase
LSSQNEKLTRFFCRPAKGELMAMEEDGDTTDKILKEGGFTVDGSSIKGMCTVENSDLRVVPEPETFLSLKVGDMIHHRYVRNNLENL